MSESETVEEVAEEYQVYRVLSEDEDFELPITNIFLTAEDTCYIELSIDNTPFYLEISTSKLPPHDNYTVLDAITGADGVTKDGLLEETVTIHIEEDLENATLKTDTVNVTFPLRREIEIPENEATAEDWTALDEKCAISTWYHTSEQLEEEKARQTDILAVDSVTDDIINLTISLGRAETTVHLPRPENADTDTDLSAEFIEDGGGDIRHLDGASIALIPENTYIKTEHDGFKTADELFSVYSMPQYESYVQEYEPGSSTSSSRSSSTTSSSPPLSKKKSKKMTRFGVMTIFQWGAFKVFVLPFMESQFAQLNTEGAESVSSMLSMIEYMFGLMLIAGILMIVVGVGMQTVNANQSTA